METRQNFRMMEILRITRWQELLISVIYVSLINLLIQWPASENMF